MRLRIGIAVMGSALLLATPATAAGSRPTVLGVSWQGQGLLARLDARTLVPVGRRLGIGAPPVGLVARSPDGRAIALGHGSVPELRFVDLRTMRATGRLRLPGQGFVQRGIWPAPNRLLVVRGGEAPEVVEVDPLAGKVRNRVPLDGDVTGAVSTAGKLLVLLTPRGGIGPTRLAVVTADGSIRTVALPGLAAGFTPAQNEPGPGLYARPGLAADPTGKRAGGGSPDALFEIDLHTLETRRKPLTIRSPARVEKLIEGWSRAALWVNDDTFAVSGTNYSLAAGQLVQSTNRVRLIDVRSGESRSLDRTATGIVRSGDTLLAFGGTSLRGYRLDGTLRFELLRGRDTAYVQTAGRWAYVGSENSTRFTVVDVRAGRIVGTTRTPSPTIVLGP